MNPQILKVHDIHAAIKDIGLDHYADRMVQDMDGNYFYIETVQMWPPSHHNIDLKDSSAVAKAKTTLRKNIKLYTDTGWEMDYSNVDTEGGTRIVLYRYKVSPVPLRLAWYIIDCLKLKAMVMETGYSEHDGPNGGKVSVYLTPGTEFMGKTVDKLTEIPANVGPVVLERL